MTDKIKNHVSEYNISKGWGVSDKDLFETIRESKSVYSTKTGSHRWYDDIFVVSIVDGMLIGYNDFYITGDNSPDDLGLDYDYNSICEVEKKEKIEIYYEPIKSILP